MSYLDRYGDELLAFAVMEQTTEPSKPYNVKVIERKGIRYCEFDSGLQTFGDRNRNGNKYMTRAVMEGIQASDLIQDQLGQGGWVGESGHPSMASAPERIVTIDPNNISHAIKKLWLKSDGRTLEGTVMTIDDAGGPGTMFTNQTLQGLWPTFSLRALAVFKTEGDGTRVCESKCRPICYDRVVGPSHKEAKINTGARNQMVFSDESFNAVGESAMIIVQESFIDSYIRDQSKRLKIVHNNMDIALEGSRYDADTGLVFVKDEGRQFSVPVEKHLQQEIRNYLSRL